MPQGEQVLVSGCENVGIRLQSGFDEAVVGGISGGAWVATSTLVTDSPSGASSSGGPPAPRGSKRDDVVSSPGAAVGAPVSVGQLAVIADPVARSG
jgi:hypothetical protein